MRLWPAKSRTKSSNLSAAKAPKRRSSSIVNKTPKTGLFSKIFRSKKKQTVKSTISTTQTPYTSRLKIQKKSTKLHRNQLKQSLQPPARLSKTKPRRLIIWLFTFLMMALAAGGTYFVFFTDYFQVNEFSILEDDTAITNNIALNNLLTDYLQKSNLFLLNQTELQQKILEKAPEYGQAQIQITWPDKVTIILEKSPQIANLNNIVLGEDNIRTIKKFIINSQGVIVQENQENPDLPYLAIISPQAYVLGMKPLPFEYLDYILKTVNLFEEKFGIKVIEVEYLPSAREIRLRTEKGFAVWLDLNYGNTPNNMLQQLDKLKRALTKLDIYQTPLEYIDLRISGTDAEKVIYKPR